MKCDKCNAADDLGANQCFKCEGCGEIFVAVELDYDDQALGEMDREVAEAAIEYVRYLKQGLWLEQSKKTALVHAVENHQDYRDDVNKKS